MVGTGHMTGRQRAEGQNRHEGAIKIETIDRSLSAS